MGRILRFARPVIAAVLVTVAFLVGAARSTAYTPPIVCDTNGVITPATMDYGQTFAANVTFPCTLSDPTYTLACSNPNGNLFFWGMTQVNCQAKDSGGSLLPPTVSFPVSVTLPPPTFQTTPGNLSFPASGPAGGPATWTTPTAVDVGGASVPVTCDQQSGLVYPIGDTVVGCTAQIQRNDSQGHPISGLPSATTQFTITITAPSSGGGGTGGGGTGGGGTGGGGTSGGTGATPDKTPPTLAPHVNLVVAATGPRGTLVRFTETATDPDDAPSATTVVCAPASGSTFALAAHGSTRSTKVTCSAHDAAGNQAAPIAFTVTVLGVHAQLAALELRVSGSTRVLASAKTSLVVMLERVDRDTHQGRTAAAQAQLGAFISSVAQLKGLSHTTRASWEATAARLITIVG